MLERAAASLRSYHEEPEFSSAPHEWITPLQLLSLWILFLLVFSPTLKQFLKSIVKGISNCIWPIDYKRQPSPMSMQYSLHPGAQKRMLGWLIEGHILVNYNLEFLVIRKKYLKSFLTQSLKFRWCIRRSWVLHKPLCRYSYYFYEQYIRANLSESRLYFVYAWYLLSSIFIRECWEVRMTSHKNLSVLNPLKLQEKTLWEVAGSSRWLNHPAAQSIYQTGVSLTAASFYTLH